MHPPLAKLSGYRGVEYCLVETNPGEWDWLYYPKLGRGVVTRGHSNGERSDAVVAVKGAIDQWLGPKKENPLAFG